MKNVLIEALEGFWRQREPREQRMLLLGAAGIVASLVYLVLVAPAWSGRQRLQANIPVLRQQVAEMNALGKQHEQLAARLAETIAPVGREQIEASLMRRGVKAQTLSVADDVVRLQINAIAYASLMEWFAEMQKAARLTVEEARLTGLTEPGQVSATLILKQLRSAPGA